jgi:cysteine desulfurase
MAYLDHAASTPTRPEVVEVVAATLRDHHANPSGAHRLARQARRVIDEARDVVAELLGAQPGEVVFTSGGTEADNLAVLGHHDLRGGVMVASAVEHHAVLDPVAARHGRFAPVDANGRVDLDALVEQLGPDVTLVSVMLVNNEVGTIEPLAEVVELVGAHAPDAVVHTDAVQAVPWLDVASAAAGADLVSISAHKFGGPKGVGALVIRGGARVAARQIGGGQERERRSGTQNVAGIAGLGTAARLLMQERAATVARVGALHDRLERGLAGQDLSVTGAGATRVPGISHTCVAGVDSESLLFLLERDEVYASAASSCASGAIELSHVLLAMGVDRERAQGALRCSLGATSVESDVDALLAVLPAAVARLREHEASMRTSS